MDNSLEQHAAAIGGGRICYLDALKCFAIFFVIEGHVRKFGMGINSYDNLSSLMLYTFDLPVFFFISGFLAYKDKTYDVKMIAKEILKKIKYLVIPAIVFLTASCLINHRGFYYLVEHGFGRYWFTITLFEYFLIYYFLLALFPKGIVKILLIVISLAGMSLLSYKSGFGPRILDTNHLCKYFYFFSLGVFARMYQTTFDKIIHNEGFKSIVILGFFFLLFLMDYKLFPVPVFHLLRDIILRVMGTAIVVMLFALHSSTWEASGRVIKLINDIGKKSLAIYLLQYFFLPDLDCFKDVVTKFDNYTIYIISFVYTIIITFTCLVFIKLLEKSKFVKEYVLGMR